MSKRTERRAAEREARKAAYQELRQKRTQQAELDPIQTSLPVLPLDIESVDPEPIEAAQDQPERTSQTQTAYAEFFSLFKSEATGVKPATSAPLSEAQLTANRANAQLSSGPVTPEGKARSSQNALKHGLTGATVLLASDDAAEYQRRLAACQDAFHPVGEEEQRLVQSMVDSLWRIDRAQNLQIGIMYKGSLEFASQFADQEPAKRRALIEVETYLKYEKSLRNLQVQEARLHRRYEKDFAELKRIQQTRKSQERQAAKASQPVPGHQNGFEFSTPKSPLTNSLQSGPRPVPSKAFIASNPLS